MNYNEMRKNIYGDIGGPWGQVYDPKSRGGCFGKSTKSNKSKCKMLCL
jgi:hypothetical protein